MKKLDGSILAPYKAPESHVTADGVEFRVEMERPEGRVFITAHGQMVDIHITEDGIGVQITKGNDVLAECGTDYDQGSA